MRVGQRNDDDFIARYGIDHDIRKYLQATLPQFWANGFPAVRKQAYAAKSCIKLVNQSCASLGSIAL